MVIHCTHHKAGTAWWHGLLKEFCDLTGRSFHFGRLDKSYVSVDVYMDSHSLFDPHLYKDATISHLIRHPRDMVVSAYYYHLWSSEKQLHKPRKDLDGLTCQEFLKAVDKDEGILFEIENMRFNIESMLQWNKKIIGLNTLEMKYEDYIQNPKRLSDFVDYHQIEERETFISLAKKHGFNKPKNRIRRWKRFLGLKSHIRNGKVNAYQNEWTPQFQARFSEIYGEDAFERLGYE